MKRIRNSRKKTKNKEGESGDGCGITYIRTIPEEVENIIFDSLSNTDMFVLRTVDIHFHHRCHSRMTSDRPRPSTDSKAQPTKFTHTNSRNGPVVGNLSRGKKTFHTYHFPMKIMLIIEDLVSYQNIDLLDYFFRDCVFDTYKFESEETEKKFVNSRRVLKVESVSLFDAVFKGNLDIIKWLIKRGMHVSRRTIYEAAAYGGHLRILKWLYADDDPILELPYVYNLTLEEYAKNGLDIYSMAAKGGHIEVLEWAKGKQFSWVTSKKSTGGPYHFATQLADENKAMRVTTWLKSNGCPWGRHELGVAKNAIKRSHLRLLKHLHYLGIPLKDEDCSTNVAHYIIQNKNDEKKQEIGFQMLEFLKIKGHILLQNFGEELGIGDIALITGHLELFKWSLENSQRVPIDSYLYYQAAGKGYLELLKYVFYNSDDVFKSQPWADTLNILENWKKNSQNNSRVEVTKWIESEINSRKQ
jgi:hypothetical protein